MGTSNPFNKGTGYEKLYNPAVLSSFLVSLVFAGYIIAKTGIAVAAVIAVLPFVYVFLFTIFTKPIYGIWVTLFLSFFAIGILRYVGNLPLGLSVDAVLLLTLIAVFLKGFSEDVPWHKLKNSLFYISLFWFIYNFFELFNPEAKSRIAWFYAMRGVALYFLLMVVVAYLLLNEIKHLNTFLFLLGIFSLLASLKGIMQQHIGVDPWEQRWLDAGAATTHVLFGKLRVFSFLSDAGQFGAQQGHAAVMGLAVGLNATKKKDKIFFTLVGIFALYGLAISGTRGAISVPLGGAIVYFFLKKNFRVLLAGFFVLIGVFIFFKYTTIGNSNYTIHRMRSAFDPNDPSLQVRLENQRKLKAYMKTRPFGGGIGSSGNWGLRFTPDTFLAQTPTDSWYVKIWVEQGIIGLVIHLLYLFYILGYGIYQIWFKVTDPELNARLGALAGGMFGIMIASYGNAVFGQIPTGPIIYISMVFLYKAEELNKQMLEIRQKEKNTPSPTKLLLKYKLG